MKKILVLLALMVAFVSCGKKENQKEILVYTAVENNLIENYLNEFNKKYPEIKVNVISSGTGDILAKLISEKDNPQADVVWALSDIMILKDYDLLEKYIPKKGYEEIADKYKDKEGYWIGVSAWLLGVGVNTEEIEKLNQNIPSSYYDLLKPEYQKNVIMANPNSSGTGYLAVSTFINLFGEEKAWEYMDSLHKNIGTYTASGNAPTQIVSRGEKVIGLIPAYQGLLIEKENIYPFKTVFPKEGIGWELEANGLIKKENIKSESKLFLDWVLSNEGMLVHSKNRGFITNEKYRQIDNYPENIEKYLKERNFEKELKERDRILKEWESRYGKGN